MRPAHVHFLVTAPGYEPLITHVFMDGDKYLDSDVVFGVKDELIAKVEKRTDPAMPDGKPRSRAVASDDLRIPDETGRRNRADAAGYEGHRGRLNACFAAAAQCLCAAQDLSESQILGAGPVSMRCRRRPQPSINNGLFSLRRLGTKLE